MMKLDKNDPRITAYVLEELSGPEREEFEAILADCPESREYVESMASTTALLSEQLGGQSALSLSGAQRAAVEREARTSTSQESSGSWNPLGWIVGLGPMGKVAFATAALATLVLAVVGFDGLHIPESSQNGLADGGNGTLSKPIKVSKEIRPTPINFIDPDTYAIEPDDAKDELKLHSRTSEVNAPGSGGNLQNALSEPAPPAPVEEGAEERLAEAEGPVEAQVVAEESPSKPVEIAAAPAAEAPLVLASEEVEVAEAEPSPVQVLDLHGFVVDSELKATTETDLPWIEAATVSSSSAESEVAAADAPAPDPSDVLFEKMANWVYVRHIDSDYGQSGQFLNLTTRDKSPFLVVGDALEGATITALTTQEATLQYADAFRELPLVSEDLPAFRYEDAASASVSSGQVVADSEKDREKEVLQKVASEVAGREEGFTLAGVEVKTEAEFSQSQLYFFPFSSEWSDVNSPANEVDQLESRVAGADSAEGVQPPRPNLASTLDDRALPRLNEPASPPPPAPPQDNYYVLDSNGGRATMRAGEALEAEEVRAVRFYDSSSSFGVSGDRGRGKGRIPILGYIPGQSPLYTEQQPSLEYPGTELYDKVAENPFTLVAKEPLSTFSIDVDTASYSNMRRFLNQGQLPPQDSIRIEEWINYFSYDYPAPEGEHPFAPHVEVNACPWNPDHLLARIGIQGKQVDMAERPPANLVFLIDVSGSMQPANKLPLIQQSLKLLLKQLREDDRVSLVTYAGSTQVVLESTPAKKQRKIEKAIEQLSSGGSTYGEAGIRLAYDQAQEGFLSEGINRVILATDGDFNVGVTDRDQLIDMLQTKAKKGIFLSIFGFGMGNLKDGTLEQLADKGNGHYGYIDNLQEARKVFVSDLSGTLVTIAKDVKLQVDFNPANVAAYRLIGYDNRMLAARDFNDDTKDAGEVGAGHTVTALYELVPPGKEGGLGGVEPSKYASTAPEPTPIPEATSPELLTVRIRYKQPEASESVRFDTPVMSPIAYGRMMESSGDFKFASSVAAFGMLLKDSAHGGEFDFDSVLNLAQEGRGEDPEGYRAEFVRLVELARALKN
jgi:Ca-activated chloride channel family protein